MVDNNRLELLLFCASIPLFVIGLIGNVLVIRIMHKTRSMHTKTNYLLVNLALSDIITISMAPLFFFSHQYEYLSNGFGKFACKFLPLTEISIAVSSITLTLLAVERYHALLKPFRTGLQLREENIKQAIALIWITSVLLCLPFFIFQEWSEMLSTCVGPRSLHMNRKTKVYVIIHSVFVTYIPLTLMVYCYGSLITGLFVNTICSDTTNGKRSAEKKKFVITFILVSAGFILGYGPFAVFYTIITSGGEKQIGFKLYAELSTVIVFLFNCSLCLNPVLYAGRSSNFQEGFKRIIFRHGPRPTNEIHSV